MSREGKGRVYVWRALPHVDLPLSSIPFGHPLTLSLSLALGPPLASNQVLQEFRKGFKLGDKLLRAAMVKVSEGGEVIKSETSQEE